MSGGAVPGGTVITVLHGDQTGEELLQEALRVLDPTVVGVPLRLASFDCSVGARRRTGNGVLHQAARHLRRHGFGLKAATVTPEGAGDVGSPNAILRAEIGGEVIVRTGRRIPGVIPLGGVHAPITVVRMAVDDAYGAKEWREGLGDGEVALRTTRITRSLCRRVATYAFTHALRTGATVFGGPKFTVSPVYEGMFKEELDAAAARQPGVRYEPQLIDAMVALILTRDDALVVPALNRDGDILADLVLALYGSLAGSESMVIGFDEADRPRVVMAEAPHGTAPRLEGRNIANPMAMILAAAALLEVLPSAAAQRAGAAVRVATLDTVAAGVRTADLGGSASTSEFTDAVIARLRARLTAA
ncbi:MAG TPA: isocitrate/isopropylmalate family dehydrogenase [Candidatus Micrarchaeia archaeon]|nr:isocitrate/isopropylmalate family dehydrogenase [Candidatus Micrarchaeia archaeon]